MEDMSEYKELFLAELEDNISLLNTTLIAVEKDPNDKGLIQDLTRAAHTVKGMAATMGFTKLTTLSHDIEDYLMSLDTISRTLIQTLFKAADKLKEFYQIVENDGDPEEVDISEIQSELEGGHELAVDDEEDILAAGTTFKLEVRFNEGARLIGARGFQVYRIIDSLAQITMSDPPINILEEGKLLGNISMEIITYETETNIKSQISSVDDVKDVLLSRLLDDDAKPAEPIEIMRKDAAARKRGIVQSVRVNLDKLDSVIDLLGELVITKGRFQSLIPHLSPEMSEQFQIFDNTINTIQNTVMGLRMVNLSRIFDTYPRAIRDIAHSRGIEIDLLLQGTHIQIDRSVVDQVNEALLHLLRNAAIHGIEDANARRSIGKPSKGTIRLAAHRERGEIVFEVEDDGGGLDIDRIRALAIERGLINKEEPMTRSQVASLIFHSGFTTARELTEVAGRGVGMDIVRDTISEISGNIQVRTKKDVGTRFIIRVPQTLAIIEALVIDVSKSIFTIPLLNVEKVFSVNDPAIEKREGDMYLNYEGHQVRILDLRGILDAIPMPENMANTDTTEIQSQFILRTRKKVILWERAGRRVGMLVDNVLEQREIVTKPLDEVYTTLVSGFSGATILGYDEVSLIIDPDNIENLIK